MKKESTPKEEEPKKKEGWKGRRTTRKKRPPRVAAAVTRGRHGKEGQSLLIEHAHFPPPTESQIDGEDGEKATEDGRPFVCSAFEPNSSVPFSSDFRSLMVLFLCHHHAAPHNE